LPYSLKLRNKKTYCGKLPKKSSKSAIVENKVICGLVLKKDIIQRLLRKDIMKESVIYQEIWSEGLQEGRQEGRQEGEANLVLRQLNRRVGDISPELLPNIRSLDLEQLENLGEALLDFQSLQDLEQWLENCRAS